MRLAKLSEFRSLIFTPESAPSAETLRAQIDANKIPGGTVLNGRYFVDLDEFDRATNLRNSLAAQQVERARNPLLKACSRGRYGRGSPQKERLSRVHDGG